MLQRCVSFIASNVHCLICNLSNVITAILLMITSAVVRLCCAVFY